MNAVSSTITTMYPAHSRDTLHARFLRRKREQSAWDAEESRDLRIAESLQLWTHFGCVTLVEYLEIYCGIEPRTALERIRVSFALAELPLLEAELEAGTFQFSHVKELSRILLPDTEEEWIHHARGMTYRDIQRAVAGHVRGDRPTDPTQPDERRRFVGFHIKPSTAARLYAMFRAIETERGDRFVDDDDRVNALCEHAIVDTPPANANAATENPPVRDASCTGCANPPAQVWITTDGHAFANGTELDDAELSALLCDATLMGNVDDPSARPQHSLTNKHRLRILARDMCQCQVPGCRSRHHLDVHHIIHREHGGDDADANLVTLCALCRARHKLHYADYGIMPRRGGALDEDDLGLRGIIRARSRRPRGCRRVGSDRGQRAAARCERALVPSS